MIEREIRDLEREIDRECDARDAAVNGLIAWQARAEAAETRVAELERELGVRGLLQGIGVEHRPECPWHVGGPCTRGCGPSATPERDPSDRSGG